MDRWGRQYAILISSFFMSLGIACIPFSRSLGALLIAAMIAGLGNGLGSGSMLTLGSDLAPRERRSEFIGAWTLIGDLGTTGAPMIIGYFADILTLPATGYVVVGGGLIALYILGEFVDETRQVDPRVVKT